MAQKRKRIQVKWFFDDVVRSFWWGYFLGILTVAVLAYFGVFK